jgi:Uma2 family endonuclease
MSLPKAFLPTLSSEEYVDLERTSEIRHEFLDGVVYAMAGESPAHSTICFNLAVSTGTQIIDKSCRGFSPNMKVRAGASGLYAYPDLMIVCGEPRFHDEHGDILVNPTVIFEVLSPSTEKYDRNEKFMRYRNQIETLRDYVMVAQDRPHVEHHSRQVDGSWRRTDVSGLENTLQLASIECQVPLADIYRNTPVSNQKS